MIIKKLKHFKVSICNQVSHMGTHATKGIDPIILTTLTMINPHKMMKNPDIPVDTMATMATIGTGPPIGIQTLTHSPRLSTA